MNIAFKSKTDIKRPIRRIYRIWLQYLYAAISPLASVNIVRRAIDLSASYMMRITSLVLILYLRMLSKLYRNIF